MGHFTVISTPPQTTGGATLAEVFGPDRGRPAAASLYIHVPFCFHKCHYCDFYSIVDLQDRQAAFADRLIDELTTLAPYAASGGPSGVGGEGGGGGLRTIFVGGGTPTLLRVDLWERLLRTLRERFDLSGSPEFTVECNPETATAELMGVLAGGGVNRVSIGAQSFVPRHLKTLERWHDPENVQRAVELARSAGIPRQSIDLIYAIPGQTAEEWSADLDRALAMNLSHLSCYSLTYEPGTAMTARLNAGQFARADEDLEADLFEMTLSRLRSAGLPRYEVSNFARPGDECRHNLAYWRQEQWLAAGPSASGHAWAGANSRAGGFRWKNVSRLGDYLASSGFSPLADLERPDAARALRERIMLGLRLAEGIDAERLLADAERVAAGAADRLRAAVSRSEEAGHVQTAGGVWRLTDAGFLMADGIAAQWMRAVG